MSDNTFKTASSATIHETDLEGSFTAGLSEFESVFSAMDEQEKTKLISLLQNTVEEIIEERQLREQGNPEHSSASKSTV